MAVFFMKYKLQYHIATIIVMVNNVMPNAISIIIIQYIYTIVYLYAASGSDTLSPAFLNIYLLGHFLYFIDTVNVLNIIITYGNEK
jgi:hypothetical protein